MLLLGDYSSITIDGETTWSLPSLCRGCIECASAAKIAESDPTQPRGSALFLCDEIPQNWDGLVLASEDIRDAKPDGKTLDGWEALTGYRPQGDTLADWAFDQLTNGADPDNLDSCGMLIPTANRRLEIWLGSRIRNDSFKWNQPYGNKIRDLLRKQWRKTKEDSIAGRLINPITKEVDLEYYLNVVDADLQKYAGLASKDDLWQALKPTDWGAKENPKKHNTTVSDDFNRANSTGLGASWSTAAGTDADVSSNQARGPSTTGATRMRYDSDLSTADMLSQILQVTNGISSNSLWSIARFPSSADTSYLWGLRSATSHLRRILKIINGGAATEIAGDDTAPSFPCTTKITVSGSTIRVYIDGSEVSALASTDTSIDGSIVGGKRAGFQGSGNTTVGSRTLHDDFTASDLPASNFYIFGPKP